jgi:formate hydrogenlyase transcriptional activator
MSPDSRHSKVTSGTGQGAAEKAATQRYETLLRVSQTLISIRSSEGLFSLLARELRAVVNFYVLGVGIYDEKAREISLKSYGEPGVPLEVPQLAPEETFTWWVYHHQQPLIIPSLDAETRFPAVAEMLKSRGVRSVCALPLTTVHRRLGGLAVGSIEADAYSKEEVSFLSLVANQVALALDDALNFEASQHAEESLRASEENFRGIVDCMPAFAWYASPDGRIEYLNQRILDFTAERQENLLGFGWANVLHPEDVETTKNAWLHSIETGEPCDVEQRVRRFDNIYRWFRTVVQPVRDRNGRVIRWYGVATEIDDRKRAEEALRASELNLRLILNTIPGLISTRAATGAPEFVNQQMLEFFGQSLEQLPDWSSLIHPDDRERVVSLWRHSVETGQPYDVEHRARRADGVYRWLHARGQPLRDPEGRIVRWCNLLTDIDDRKRVEEALRASELNLRLVVDSIPGLVCTMSAAGEFQLFNRQILEYFGKTPEELKSWATGNLVHPDDLSRVITAFTSSIGAGHPYDSEHRCRRADGVYRWFQVRALPVRDTEGRIGSWYILFTDIDKRKQAEDRLQLLLDVTNQVVSNLHLHDLLSAITASVRRVMQCDLVSVCFPDSEGQRLRTFALDFPGSKGSISEGKFNAVDESIGGHVYRAGKPWTGHVSDLLQLGLKDEAEILEGLKTGCILPLVRRHRVLGLVSLARREEMVFSEADVEFLAQVVSQIAIAVENALEYGQLTEAKERLAEQKLYLEEEIRLEHNFEEIIGNSPRLKAVLDSIRIVAPVDSTVLIQGETGTGKEMIARAIHNLSPRKSQAFVKVNCAAIPLGLLESELFGHERGAFTGAIAQKVGRFELAHKGTLFLDEVGDIPLELQPKLLRVLQEQEFERLGSTRTQRVDVRLLAATNVSLSQMVAEKKFRSDLYYRLKVFPIDVPPLRERREDIPLLIRYFANKYARRMGKQIESIPKEAMDALTHYSWPGNIRELQNLMERAALLSTGPSLRVPLAEIVPDSDLSAASGDNALKQAEREQIVRALRESNWVVGGAHGAAVRLGLKRTSLAYKIRKLGISRPPQ